MNEKTVLILTEVCGTQINHRVVSKREYDSNKFTAAVDHVPTSVSAGQVLLTYRARVPNNCNSRIGFEDLVRTLH